MIASLMEAVQKEREDEEAEQSVPDRRANPWLNPQFLFQIALIVVGVYVASQMRTAALETAASNLNEKATRMEAQVTAIAGSVQTISNQSAEMRATQTSQSREIDDLKMAKSMAESRIIVLEKSVARLEARAGR